MAFAASFRSCSLRGMSISRDQDVAGGDARDDSLPSCFLKPVATGRALDVNDPSIERMRTVSSSPLEKMHFSSTEFTTLRLRTLNPFQASLSPVEDEDAEDDEIRPTDSLLVVAITEDEFSHLEVQLFTDDGNLYCHHDITLPDFPLCLAWMDCPPFQGDGGTQMEVGNYIAVGTFSPEIEIWNLDVLDPLEPSAVLGGVDEIASRKKKKNKKGKTRMKPGMFSQVNRPSQSHFL